MPVESASVKRAATRTAGPGDSHGGFRDNSESDNFRRRYGYAATTPVPPVVTWPELTFRALARETSERVRRGCLAPCSRLFAPIFSFTFAPDFCPIFICFQSLLTYARPPIFMRKQLDPRIPILINNNVKKNHRSFIVLVGDKGRDQVRSCATVCMVLCSPPADCKSPLPALTGTSIRAAICIMVL